MKKFIVRFDDNTQRAYLCNTNFSKTYSAGVLEFETEEEARKAADLRGLKNYEVIPVTI